MEEKYENFLKYDWNNSEEWKMYYNNLFPQPKTDEAIIKFKKRFYKFKVDADFDDKYTINNIDDNDNTNSNSNPPPPTRSKLDHLLAAIEGFVWVSYFLNIFLQQPIHRNCLVALYFRLLIDYKNNFSSLFSTEIFKDQNIQLIIYLTILLFADNLNYLFLFPLSVTALFYICDYFANFLRIFQFLRKYFQIVIDRKEYIFSIRAFSYILIGVHLIFALIIGWNNILFCVFYWIFLRFLYSYNEYVKKSFLKIRKSIEIGVIENKNKKVPKVFKILLNFLIKVIERLG
jgi:hypothetical protein